MSLAAVAVAAVAVYAFGHHGVPTTTPPTQSAPASATASASSAADLREYRNSGLGLSFKYPANWGSPSLAVVPGTAGRQFQGRFSDVPVTFGGNTADYVANGGGAQLYDFYEFTDSGSGSFKIRFAPAQYSKFQTFTADPPKTLPGGASAIIVAGQEYPQVFSAVDRIAYVNLPSRAAGIQGMAARYAQIPSARVPEFDAFVLSVTPEQ